MRRSFLFSRSCALVATLGLLIASVGCKPQKAAKAPQPASSAQDTLLEHERFTLTSKILGESREIAVYLPPQYTVEPQRNFAVLYMPDGGVKEDFPHVSFTINELIQQGNIEPMLVVGVANKDRRKDLTTPTQVKKEQEAAPHAGGAHNFHEFFEQELKPAIAARYRIASMPSAIVGESLAGRWIVEGWLQHPERFDHWIAVDPSLWWNQGELFKSMESALAPGKSRAPSRLYLSGAYLKKVGNLDKVQKFVQELRRLGVPSQQWVFESYPNYGHYEIFRRSEAQAYRAMFGAIAKGRR